MKFRLKMLAMSVLQGQETEVPDPGHSEGFVSGTATPQYRASKLGRAGTCYDKLVKFIRQYVVFYTRKKQPLILLVPKHFIPNTEHVVVSAKHVCKSVLICSGLRLDTSRSITTTQWAL